MLTAADQITRAFAFTGELNKAFSYVTSEPLTSTTYRNAIVTPRRYFDNGTFTGAVYDETGSLVPSTLRFNVGDIRPVDPLMIDESDVAAAQSCRMGAAVYGGILFPILGHFFFETVARFWPLVNLDLGSSSRSALPTLACFHHWPSLEVPLIWSNPLYAAVLQRFGIAPADLVVVDRPVLFETLIVPEPASIYHERLDRRMAEVFQHIARGIVPAPSRPVSAPGRVVHMSRSRWPDNRRVVNEPEVDAALSLQGIEIVHPQELAPQALIALLQDVDTLIAFDGSQAHLAIFCRPGTRVVMLDTRLTPTQVALEQLLQLRSTHVPLFESELYSDAKITDVATLAETVRSIVAGNLA